MGTGTFGGAVSDLRGKAGESEQLSGGSRVADGQQAAGAALDARQDVRL